jgi:hypothetical protein
MKQAVDAQDARHRYIDILRSLNPDAVLRKRLDAIESAPKIMVTRADVRDVVTHKARGVPSVIIDAVVTELDQQLDLVGEHNMTTALRPDTVEPWIEMQIDGALGDDGFNQIVQRRLH